MTLTTTTDTNMHKAQCVLPVLHEDSEVEQGVMKTFSMMSPSGIWEESQLNALQCTAIET